MLSRARYPERAPPVDCRWSAAFGYYFYYTAVSKKTRCWCYRPAAARRACRRDIHLALCVVVCRLMRTDEVSNARRLYSTSVQTHPTLSEVACGYCGRHAGRSSITSTTSNTSNTTIVSDASSLTPKNWYAVSRADVNSVASGTSVPRRLRDFTVSATPSSLSSTYRSSFLRGSPSRKNIRSAFNDPQQQTKHCCAPEHAPGTHSSAKMCILAVIPMFKRACLHVNHHCGGSLLNVQNP